MIRIPDLRLPIGWGGEDLFRALKRRRIDPEGAEITLDRLSLDARKKNDLHYRAAVLVSLPDKSKERRLVIRDAAQEFIPVRYIPPEHGAEELPHRPVIVGTGPAGLFAGLILAEEGYRPLLFERGDEAGTRTEKVGKYWHTGQLDPESNVQFGEGGAGTFSDGKLFTQVKDRSGRIRKVLESFVRCGADESILYQQRPHLGTDRLRTIIPSLRREIEALGGRVFFRHRMTRLTGTQGRICGAVFDGPDGEVRTDAECLILAIGHSARDTFRYLAGERIPMAAKDFAMGVRIQHPQAMIQLAQYGTEDRSRLPAADYHLHMRSRDGRGVYSFCMCPGGSIVDASSEEGRIAVNGMSLSGRDGRYANAAIAASVGSRDFAGEDPLAGMVFQEYWERQAWLAGEGRVPVQLFGDFLRGMKGRLPEEAEISLEGRYAAGDLNLVLPQAVAGAVKEGIGYFGRQIAGFDREDAVLAGPESRTSSPVRILRDEYGESPVKGLFPCGEGAGYAGGITSAAVDGIRTAETIIRRYRTPGGREE